MPDPDTPLLLEMQPSCAGMRLDRALSQSLPEHSRAAIQQWLKQGLVRVDGAPAKQSLRLAGGERVTITPPPADAPADDAADAPAQPMDLDIIHHDADIAVINKPPGLVVHPGAGRADRTLLNALLHWDESLRALPRAGIVHRLDKDTSGLLVVARNEAARRRLIAQLDDRSMARSYLAVANGVMVAGERIEQPIGRHRRDRLRMCVTARGKAAATRIRVAQKFRSHCLLQAELESGRTHQIRVHLSWRGFALVGDSLYGARVRLPPDCGDDLRATLRQFSRQALHAEQLSLRHPRDGEQRHWRQPMPHDLQRLVAQLTEDCERHRRSGE
ncbi:MAG: RluA family pseudouridine synthase [bacterium]